MLAEFGGVALGAVGGLLLERRLRGTSARSVSILSSLAIVLSSPVLGSAAGGDIAPALLFATGCLAMFLLSAESPTRSPAGTIARGLITGVLAVAPAVVVLARASWRQFYPEAGLVALFGGEGLLYNGPLLWTGILGLFPLWRENRALARLCVVAIVAGLSGLAVGTEGSDVAVRSAMWIPFLAPGLARCFEGLHRTAARRPERVLTAAGLLLVAWNLLFMEQYRVLLIPNDNTTSFARVTANSARLMGRMIGTPMAWPANAIFAARTNVPAAFFDGVAGRRLFANPSTETVTIEIGDDASDFAPDLPLLVGGFGERRTCARGWCRDVYASGRILIPLQNPGTGDLTIRLAARGEGTLRIAFDRPAAAAVHDLTESLESVVLRIPARDVAPGIHVLTIEVAGGGKATVDKLTIERTLGVGSATARPR